MGMRAKLRHVSATELEAARKDSAKFYRDLYGVKGEGADRKAMLENIGLQMGQALGSSAMGKEFAELPEARRIAEATKQGKAPDPADQQAVVKKLMELLPKTNFRADFSQVSKSMPKVTKVPKGLELEKSWHCLHFLLSGKVWEAGETPIEQAILGGAEIPDLVGVMGYGPVRFFEPTDVRKIATALETYPIEQKAKAFDQDAAATAKVYCPKHSPEELVYYFNLVKNYYREAVSKGHAMLIWVE